MRTAARWSRCITVALLTAGLAAPAAGAGGWETNPSSKRERSAAKSVAEFKERMPRLQKYFDEAYGYAVYHTIGRVGFGLGGAYGAGVVVEQGEIIGTTKFYQFTSGIQGGVRVFRMIVFFKDREALEHFKQRKLQFMGQASVTLVTVGAAADSAYNSGVAVFTLAKGGLMYEATISGASFGFKALK